MASILVIENDKLLQKAFRRMLKDHEVTMVATGLEAIAALEDGKFEAVVSDYDLDGPLTGNDVWKWVEVNRLDLIKRYGFCSGNEDAERLCKRAQIPYVDKPASTAQIQALVATLLKGE